MERQDRQPVPQQPEQPAIPDPGKVPTLYLTNHDHPDAAWQAGARDNAGAMGAEAREWCKTQPFAIALFTSTAVPLIPNGQEFGEDHFIPEDDQGTGRRVRPDPSAGSSGPIGREQRFALYSTLATLRRDHPAFRAPSSTPRSGRRGGPQFNLDGVGIDVERQLAIYHRWAAFPAARREPRRRPQLLRHRPGGRHSLPRGLRMGRTCSPPSTAAHHSRCKPGDREPQSRSDPTGVASFIASFPPQTEFSKY